MSAHGPQDSLTGAIVSGEIAHMFQDEPQQTREEQQEKHRSRHHSKAISTIQEHLEEAREIEIEANRRDTQSSAKEIAKQFPTDPKTGLTEEEAAQRLLEDGPNELEADENVPVWKVFIMQFMNFLILLLLAACVASFALEEIAEGVAIIIIVILNAIIATYTEKSASDALAALASLSQPDTEVLRNGQTKRIPTRDVVKGDIINVYCGDVAPADCLLLSSADLKVNEMPLTGEAADVTKNFQITSSDQKGDQQTLTAPNRIFSSTTVTAGSGKGLVIAIGMDTRVGDIARRLAGDDDEVKRNCLGVKAKRETPLQMKLHKLGLMIATLALCACIGVFAIGVGRDFKDPEHPDDSVVVAMILIAVALGVSAIPEGLPLCVTIALALGTNDMAKNWNALVRNLPAVETLGSANVVCSDKTGTLTQGKMTCLKMYALGVPNDAKSHREIQITTGGLTPVGEFLHNGTNVMEGKGDLQLKGILANAILNSTAHLKIQEDQRKDDSIRPLKDEEMDMEPEQFKDFAINHMWAGEGNNSEIPLIVAGMKAHIFKEKEDQKHPSVGWRACEKEGAEIPFSSSRKMMASVVHTDDGFLGAIELPAGSKYCVLVKGAPNYVLKKCKKAMYKDCSYGPFTEDDEAQVNSAVDDLSSQALRVLGFAMKPLKELPYDPEDSNVDAEDKFEMLVHDLTFAGLMASIDPAREGVGEAISTARHAGVKTIMITGDYLKTAAAIAKNIGLITVNEDPEQAAVDCKTLRPHEDEYLPDADLDEITSRVIVFARAQPEDKLQIVKSLQRQGSVVGMTGDGVNDAPALNEADIGVAMGIAGTEVAKGASDMILLDDNFVTIVSAIRKGRQIYNNIQKFITYLLGTNVTQVFVILTSVIVGLPVPLGPLGILFLNLAIDGVPAMSLSIQPEDDDIMERRPRPKTESLILNRMWIKVLSHAVVTSLVTLVSFAVGLEWFVGQTFTEDMFSGDDPIEVCTVRQEDGSRRTIEDEDCVSDGVGLARTMAFITIVYAEVLRGLSVRSHEGIWYKPLTNKYLLLAIGISGGLATLLILTPGLRDLFGFEGADLKWWAWLFALALSFATVVSDEILKWYLRATDEKKQERDEMRTYFETVLLEMRQIRHSIYDMESKLHLREDRPNRRAEIQESMEIVLRKQGLTAARRKSTHADGSGAAADSESINVHVDRH